MNWESLEISTTQFGNTFVISRPSLVINVYWAEETENNVSKLINYFMGECFNEEIFLLTEKGRSFKPVKASGINRLIEKCISNQTKYLFLKNAPEFDIGFKSIELDLGIYTFEETIKSAHLAFPIDYFEYEGQEIFFKKIKDLIIGIKPQHVAIGYGFSLVFGREWEMIALPKIFSFAKRYRGFEIPHRYTEAFLNGKIKSPSWITYLSKELASHITDLRSIETLASESEIYYLNEGILIRSDPFPPIGDVNRQSKDIKNLRVLSKVLKPICIETWAATNLFGDFMDEANDWFKRFENEY